MFEPSAGDAGDLVDASKTGDAGESPTRYEFTDGLGPWTIDPGCERRVDEADNAIVCCTATGTARSIITLAIPPSRAVEIDFKLQLTEQSAGTDPEEFSPLAAINDTASTSSAVLANLNTFPDSSFTVASIPGAGPLGSEHTQAFRLDSWFDLRFSAGTDAGCDVRVVIEDEDGERFDEASITITTTLEPSFSHVILGVFRQKSGAGRSTRCFDDVTVRQLASCP